MSPQLRAIVDDLESAARRVTRLAQATSAETWRYRPAPGSWSAHECVAHLNLMSEALLSRLRAALTEARETRRSAPSAYRRDWMGWLIGQAMTPGGGLKTTTVEAFRPTGEEPADEVLATFTRLQAELVNVVRAADGAALDAVRVTSPYDDRVRYNLYSALLLVPRHQHRHLLQAERAVHACFAAQSAAAV